MLNRIIAPPVHNAADFNFQLPDCQKTKFFNGIPVYWLNAGTQDVLQIEWVFKAGLWEEEHTGIAHATAGLLINGTSKRNAEAISEALELYGASLKSIANNDYSTIILHCLTKHLAKVLPVIQEIIFEAIYPENELDIYRKNALQHLSVNLQKVDFVADREAEAQVFGYDHPYGRFSKAEALNHLTAEALRTFHQRYYTSSNCQIFIAGNIHETHVEQVASYFGNAPWGGNQEPILFKKFELQPGKDRRLQFQMDEKNVQGAVRLLRHFPVRQHPDFAPMVVLNTLLGGYFGSRLMDNIREEKGYTYGIYSTIYAYRNESCLIISTEAGSEVCKAVIEESWKELARLRDEPISKEELSLVKNYLFGGLLSDLDGPFNLIRRWKSLILNGFEADHFYKNIDIYKSVQSVQLQELAQKYFQQDDFYEVLVW
jgi:predicted Zn-dependent peptidase